MRIGYVATDEINGVGRPDGRQVRSDNCHLRPREVHPDGLFDAVLYNLDDVPRDQQPAFLEELCLGTTDCPTAVHGYGIADEQAQALRRQGVAVAGRPPGPARNCARRACARRHDGVADRPIRRRPDGLDLGQPGQVTEPRFRPTPPTGTTPKRPPRGGFGRHTADRVAGEGSDPAKLR